MLAKIENFFNTGYNLYYVIAAAFVTLVVVLIIVAVASQRRKKSVKPKKGKSQTTALPNESNQVDTYSFNESLYKKEETDLNLKEVINESETKTDTVKTVVPTPVAKKVKPKPEPKKVEESVAIATKKAFEREEVEDDANLNKRPGVIQIYKDAKDQFRFRIWAANKYMVGHSKGYDTKVKCKQAIADVERSALLAEVIDNSKGDLDIKLQPGASLFEIYKDVEDKFRFRLFIGRNVRQILASQGYTTKDNCIKGISSVRYIALNNSINDTSKQPKETKIED